MRELLYLGECEAWVAVLRNKSAQCSFEEGSSIAGYLILNLSMTTAVIAYRRSASVLYMLVTRATGF